MRHRETLAAACNTLPLQDFVLDGTKPEARPATAQKLQAGVVAHHNTHALGAVTGVGATAFGLYGFPTIRA